MVYCGIDHGDEHDELHEGSRVSFLQIPKTELTRDTVLPLHISPISYLQFGNGNVVFDHLYDATRLVSPNDADYQLLKKLLEYV